MALPRRLSPALGFAVAAVVVVGASAAQSTAGAVTQKVLERRAAEGAAADAARASGSASLLLELLRELQQEAEAGLRLSSAVSKQCSVVRSHRRSMSEALRRQLGETEAARRRLDAEQSRFEGEREMSSAATQEQARRLSESTSLLKVAGSSFSEEQQQLDQAINATDAALRLLRRRAGQAEVVQAVEAGQGQADEAGSLEMSLAKLRSSGQLTEQESGATADYLQTDGGSDAGERSEEMIKMLAKLRSRLGGDKSAAEEEQQALKGKFEAYADRLNVSILETQSQLATVTMEAAQRKRERAFLDRRGKELGALSKAVEASSAAADDACHEEDEQKHQLSHLIQAESKAVNAMLQQLPTDGFLVVTAEAPEPAPPSFMQTGTTSGMAAAKAIQNLADMAREFPDEAGLYSDAVQSLNKEMASEGADIRKLGQKAPDLEKTLQNIQDFAASDDDEASATPKSAPEEVDKVKAVYGGLLKHVMEKEEAAGKTVSDCGSVIASAKADKAALKRSLQQLKAKSKIVTGAIAQCEEDSRYDIEQKKIVEKQSSQGAYIAAEAKDQRDRLVKLLGDRSKQLVSLAEQFGQKSSADGPGASKQATDLLRILQKHRAALLRQSTGAPEKQRRAQVADARMVRLLDESARRAGRRVLQLKSEAALLTSLVQGRERALEAADDDAEATALCSEVHDEAASKRKAKALATLQRQEVALRGALSSADA